MVSSILEGENQPISFPKFDFNFNFEKGKKNLGVLSSSGLLKVTFNFYRIGGFMPVTVTLHQGYKNNSNNGMHVPVL